MRLQDKVAIITGGGSGIGQATAVAFASEGAHVVVCGRREDALTETVDLMQREAGGHAYYVAGDVTVKEDAERIVADSVGKFGRLDILVNNAGQIRRNLPLGETDDEEWERLLRVNLTGVFLMSRAAIPAMLETDGGAIVNNASTLAVVAVPGIGAYSAAKGGVVALTRSLAIDYAPKIRANCVCPGLVETPLSHVDRPDFDDRKEAFAASHPLERIGRPEDVAPAIVFLASDEASWITGASLIIDGGFTLR